jgi:hypothetical protein
MAKSVTGELEGPGKPGQDELAFKGKPLLPGSKGDAPIGGPPKPQHPLLDAAADKVAEELAKLPIHDGDVPRVARLVHELQQLTDPGSLNAVKLAAERHLTSVLQAAKAQREADAAAEQEAKAAALKAHRDDKTATKDEPRLTFESRL